MKKIFSFFILYILVNLAANAQSEALFSNYMISRTFANPGFTGAEKTINAVFCNRTMFAGFGDGKPVTSVFGLDAPFEIMGLKSGFGVLIVGDEIGFYNNVNVDASLAFHHSLQNGTLGGGLNFGFKDYGLVGDWYVPDDDYHAPVSDDKLIPQGEVSNMAFSIGAGMYYETPDYYVGLSASNINQPAMVDNATDSIFAFYKATVYLTGAYNIELPDPLFDLQPSFMLRTDLAACMLDLNGTIYYKNKYWGGLGVRLWTTNIAAVTFLGGVELMNGLNLGYAMDFNTTAMIGAGATSHEILVTYSFNLDTKRDQKYKSIRYL